MAAIAASAAATPVGMFSDVGDCYALKLNTSGSAAVSTAMAALRTNTEVLTVEPDYIGTLNSACSGVVCSDVSFTSVLQFPRAQTFKDGTGTGVLVAIIDSGVDLALFPNSSPLIRLGNNYVANSASSLPVDDNGHGSAVAAIAAAPAPDAILLIEKIADSLGRLSCNTVYGGLADAKAKQAKIVNMSLTFPVPCSNVTQMVAVLQASGTNVVAAAGNEGSNAKKYPAANLGVTAVGATDTTNVRSSFSNFGNWVNIAAPGTNILTPVAQFASASGTSFAAPFVAGTIAVIRSKFPNMSEADAKLQLYRSALPIPEKATLDLCPSQPCNQDLGFGRIDPQAALGAIRFKRATAVGASGAVVSRQIDVLILSSAGATVFNGSISLLGQKDHCEVITVSNPPCIDNLPFDFAALPTGTYNLRLRFVDTTARVDGDLELMAPGASFASVISGNGSLDPSNPARATFSLIGFSTNSALFTITKK